MTNDLTAELLETVQKLLAELEWWEHEHGCCKGVSTAVIDSAYRLIAKAIVRKAEENKA